MAFKELKIFKLFLVFTIFHTVASNTFYGKLVLKISVASKKTNVFLHKPTVFATRRSTYMKKDGDVFQIHMPGIAKNSTKDSISFESVRFPGYFLRHKKFNDDYRFRIAKAVPTDEKFDNDATFFIQRHSGIEGSGMLRLFDDPSYYLCVRKYNYADSALKAMRNDNTEDFRARCSFFIQKLKPERVGDEVRKSTESDNKAMPKPISHQNAAKQMSHNDIVIKPVVKPTFNKQLKPVVKLGVNKGSQNTLSLNTKKVPAGSNLVFSKQGGINEMRNKPIPKQKQVPIKKLNGIKPNLRKPVASPNQRIGKVNNSSRTQQQKSKTKNTKLTSLKSSAIKEKQIKAFLPPENVVRKLLDDYVKKIETESKNFFANGETSQPNPGLRAPNNEYLTAKTWVNNPSDINNQQNMNDYPTNMYQTPMSNLYTMSNGYSGQNYLSSDGSTLSYFPVVSRYDPTRTYIRSFFQENDENSEKMVNPEKSKPVEVGMEKASWRNEIRPNQKSNVSPDIQQKQTKQYHSVVGDKSKQKPKITAKTKSSTANNHVTSRHSNKSILPAKDAKHTQYTYDNSSHEILKDTKQSKQRHQEPSLNLDGFPNKVSISDTRSKLKKNLNNKSRRIYGTQNRLIASRILGKSQREHSLNLGRKIEKGNPPAVRSSILSNTSNRLSEVTKNKNVRPSTNATIGKLTTKPTSLIDSGTTLLNSKKGSIERTQSSSKSTLKGKPPLISDKTDKMKSTSTVAKKEMLIDETLKNFTGDADVDFKLFSEDKVNETSISKDDNKSKTNKNNYDNKIKKQNNMTDNNTTDSKSENESDVTGNKGNAIGNNEDNKTEKEIDKGGDKSGANDNKDEDEIEKESDKVENDKRNQTTTGGVKQEIASNIRTSGAVDGTRILKTDASSGDLMLRNSTVAQYVEGNKTVEQHEEIFTNEKLESSSNKLTNQTFDGELTVFDTPRYAEKVNKTKDHASILKQLNPPVVQDNTKLIPGNYTEKVKNETLTSVAKHNETKLLTKDTFSEFYPNVTLHSENSTSKTASEPKQIVDNSTVLANSSLGKSNSTQTVTKEKQNSTIADNIHALNSPIGNITNAKNVTDHKVNPFATIKEIKIVNNGEEESSIHEESHQGHHEEAHQGHHEEAHQQGQHTLSSESPDSDNIPFDESTTADGSETGDNIDVGNDESHTSLANILGQAGDGIEYDNVDKATTFRDLGASEMKGIASAMSKLNAQDVTHLKSNMKTIDFLDKNAPNHFGHLSKASSGFQNGLHTNGINFDENENQGLNENQLSTNEQPITVGQVQNSLTLESGDSHHGFSEHNLKNENSIQAENAGIQPEGTGNEETFNSEPEVSQATNENTMQEQGFPSNEMMSHESQTSPDPVVQDASSVPVEISAAAPDTTTNAQDSLENVQQLTTGSTQTPESPMTSNSDESSSMHSNPISRLTSAFHQSLGSNQQTANEEPDSIGNVAQRSDDSNELANKLSEDNEEGNVALIKQKLHEIDEAESNSELENLNDGSTLTAQPDVNDNNAERSKMATKRRPLLRHHSHHHQHHQSGMKHHQLKSNAETPKITRHSTVVKGVAKNTILRVPIAISYTRLPQEDANINHHKVEHILNDVIHDVKNELHGIADNDQFGTHITTIKHQTQIYPGHTFHTLAVNEILPHSTEDEDNSRPVIGSPTNKHPVSVYETEKFQPTKCIDCGEDVDEFDDAKPEIQHEVNVVRHTHHVVTVKDESEKQKMVNGLVNYDTDRCVSLQLINNLGNRYRLISSINKHGYTPRGKVFTLKTVFKDPSAHKFVSFHAIDEHDPTRQVTLDGAKELISVPTPCKTEPKPIIVSSPQPQTFKVPHEGEQSESKKKIKKKNLIMSAQDDKENESNDDVDSGDNSDDDGDNKDEEESNKNLDTEITKKNRIEFPFNYSVTKVHPLKHKKQKISHVYFKNSKKDTNEGYPSQFDQIQNIRNSDTDTFFGKLVLKISPVSTRGHINHPFIFATRRSTYLKKDGDIFKIHTPGLSANAGRDSISFESVRWPGYFLKHRAEENDLKFRIAKSSPSTFRIFNKEATFVVEKHNGIEGSGMLRLSDKPNWYMCVRKHDISSSALKAMRNDHSADFQRRCSFFIEKLEPAIVIREMMKYTDDNRNSGYTWQGGVSKRKQIHRPVYKIREMLEQFLNRGKLEVIKDQMIKATSNVQRPQLGAKLVNNYMSSVPSVKQRQPNEQSFWTNQAYSNPLNYVQSNTPMQVIGRVPQVKTGIARLSDRIAKLSNPSVNNYYGLPNSRLSKYQEYNTNSDQNVNLPPSTYSLYNGNMVFPVQRFSRAKQNYQSIPSNTFNTFEGSRREKKTEISKVYNDSSTGLMNLMNNKNNTEETVTEKTEFIEIPPSSASLHFLDDNPRTDVIQLDEEHSSKKMDDFLSSTKVLSTRSETNHIVNDTHEEYPTNEKYVKTKHVENKFYNTSSHQKLLDEEFDGNGGSKDEQVNHIYTDEKGRIVEDSRSHKNFEEISNGKFSKESEVSHNDGMPSDKYPTAERFSESNVINSTLSDTSEDQINTADVTHLYTDAKGHVKVLDKYGSTKLLDGKDSTTEQKQTIGLPTEGESRSIKVQHLYADNNGNIAGVAPKPNSILGKLTSPSESLAELTKLGKKVKLGVHCKRSHPETIDVAECSDESEVEGGQGIMEEELQDHNAQTLPDNAGQKELKMIGLDLSHVSHSNVSDEEALESLESEDGLGHIKKGYAHHDKHKHHAHDEEYEDHHDDQHYDDHHDDDHHDDDHHEYEHHEHHDSHHEQEVEEEEKEEGENSHHGGSHENGGEDSPHYEDEDGTEDDDHHETSHGHEVHGDGNGHIGHDEEEDEDEHGEHSEHAHGDHGFEDHSHHHHDHHHHNHHEDGHFHDYPGHHWVDNHGEHHVYEGDTWEDDKKKEGDSKITSNSGSKAKNSTTSETNSTPSTSKEIASAESIPSTALNNTKPDTTKTATNVSIVTSDKNSQTTSQLLKASNFTKDNGKSEGNSKTDNNIEDVKSFNTDAIKINEVNTTSNKNQSNKTNYYENYSNWNNSSDWNNNNSWNNTNNNLVNNYSNDTNDVANVNNDDLKNRNITTSMGKITQNHVAIGNASNSTSSLKLDSPPVNMKDIAKITTKIIDQPYSKTGGDIKEVKNISKVIDETFHLNALFHNLPNKNVVTVTPTKPIVLHTVEENVKPVKNDTTPSGTVRNINNVKEFQPVEVRQQNRSATKVEKPSDTGKSTPKILKSREPEKLVHQSHTKLATKDNKITSQTADRKKPLADLKSNGTADQNKAFPVDEQGLSQNSKTAAVTGVNTNPKLLEKINNKKFVNDKISFRVPAIKQLLNKNTRNASNTSGSKIDSSLIQFQLKQMMPMQQHFAKPALNKEMSKTSETIREMLRQSRIKTEVVKKLREDAKPTEQITLRKKSPPGFLNETDDLDTNRNVLHFHNKYKEINSEFGKHYKSTDLVDKNFSIPRSKLKEKTTVVEPSKSGGRSGRINKYVFRLKQLEREKELKEKGYNSDQKSSEKNTKESLSPLIAKDESKRKNSLDNRASTSKEIMEVFERIPDNYIVKNDTTQKNRVIKTEKKDINMNSTDLRKTSSHQDKVDENKTNETSNGYQKLRLGSNDNDINETLDAAMLDEEKDFVENALENNVGNSTILKEELKDLEKDRTLEFDGSGEDNGSGNTDDEEKQNSTSHAKKMRKKKDQNKMKGRKTDVDVKKNESKIKTEPFHKTNDSHKSISLKLEKNKDDKKPNMIHYTKTNSSKSGIKIEDPNEAINKLSVKHETKPKHPYSPNTPLTDVNNNNNVGYSTQQSGGQQNNNGGRQQNNVQHKNDPFKVETVNDIYLYKNTSYNPELEGLKRNSSKKKDKKNSQHFITINATDESLETFHSKHKEDNTETQTTDDTKNGTPPNPLKFKVLKPDKIVKLKGKGKTSRPEYDLITNHKELASQLDAEFKKQTDNAFSNTKNKTNNQTKDAKLPEVNRNEKEKEKPKIDKTFLGEGDLEDGDKIQLQNVFLSKSDKEKSDLKENDLNKTNLLQKEVPLFQEKELKTPLTQETVNQERNQTRDKKLEMSNEKKMSKEHTNSKLQSSLDLETIDNNSLEELDNFEGLDSFSGLEEANSNSPNFDKDVTERKKEYESGIAEDRHTNSTKQFEGKEQKEEGQTKGSTKPREKVKEGRNNEVKEMEGKEKKNRENKKKENERKKDYGKESKNKEIETKDNESKENKKHKNANREYENKQTDREKNKESKTKERESTTNDKNESTGGEKKIKENKRKEPEKKESEEHSFNTKVPKEDTKTLKDVEKENSKENGNVVFTGETGSNKLKHKVDGNKKENDYISNITNTAFDDTNSISPSLSVENVTKVNSLDKNERLKGNETKEQRKIKHNEKQLNDFNRLLNDVLAIKQRSEKTETGTNQSNEKAKKYEGKTISSKEDSNNKQKNEDDRTTEKDKQNGSLSKPAATKTNHATDEDDSGETLTGIAKAMAEIMAKNADKISDNGIEDLENIDKNTQNILSETDQDEPLTNENESTKQQDSTKTKNIASTSDSYYISEKKNNDGDNLKINSSNSKQSNSIQVLQKNKLHVKVPLSYTRPASTNLTANEKLKNKQVINRTNDNDQHDSKIVSSFTNNLEASSKESDLIHEFKQLFNIDDIGETDEKDRKTKDRYSSTEKKKPGSLSKFKIASTKGNDGVSKTSHQHRIVTVKDEAEKERMVNGLVADVDRCVSLQFINELGNRFKLVSSINNHGYTPRGKIFTLKQVFKDPSSHRSVSFHAYDELDEQRTVLLNGAQELVCVPVSCKYKPHKIKVTSRQPSKENNFKKDNVLNKKTDYPVFEEENENAICPSSCTEYCAATCPAYCCSAPIPGGLGSRMSNNQDDLYETEENNSRDFLPSPNNIGYPRTQRYLKTNINNDLREEMEDEDIKPDLKETSDYNHDDDGDNRSYFNEQNTMSW